MKKILLVSCEGLGNGGVQSVMMNLVRNLSDNYIFDILLFTSEKRYYDDEFLRYGGNIIRLPNYEGKIKPIRYFDVIFRSIWRIRQVEQAIRENGPYDAIHCHNESEAGLCLEAAYNMQIPVRIAHFHVATGNENFVVRQLNRFYESKISKYATTIIGCSQETIQSKKLAHKGDVINNPYDDDKFKIISDLGVQRPFSLLQVGGYCDNKNQLFTLQLLTCLKKDVDDIQLSFVGFDMENGYRAKLCKFIDENGLNDNVTFFPSNVDIPALLDKCSYLIQPSKKEGFGITLIEAQATGCRCFASDSIPMTTDCGGCTYFSLSDDLSELAHRIIEDYKKNKGKHFAFDCKKYSKCRFVSQIAKIYG